MKSRYRHNLIPKHISNQAQCIHQQPSNTRNIKARIVNRPRRKTHCKRGQVEMEDRGERVKHAAFFAVTRRRNSGASGASRRGELSKQSREFAPSQTGWLELASFRAAASRRLPVYDLASRRAYAPFRNDISRPRFLYSDIQCLVSQTQLTVINRN